MKTIKGDIITLAEQGKFDIVIHGCNCFCTFGSGLAAQIKEAWPEVYEADKRTKNGDVMKLGTAIVVPIRTNNRTFTVMNAYTQYEWSNACRKTEYSAIISVFKRLYEFCKTFDVEYRIGIPKIGSGYGRGDWNIISGIIQECLGELDYTIVEYDG